MNNRLALPTLAIVLLSMHACSDDEATGTGANVAPPVGPGRATAIVRESASRRSPRNRSSYGPVVWSRRVPMSFGLAERASIALIRPPDAT